MTKTTWVDDTTYATATELNRIEDQLLVICTSSTRPTGVDGQHIYETDTNRRYHYDGSSWIGRTDDAWTSFTPSWTNLTVGNGTNSGEYRYVNGDVVFEVKLDLGSTSSVSGSIQLTLPVAGYGARVASGCQAFCKDGGTRVPLQVYDISASVVALGAVNASSTYASVTGTSATIPFTWASGDNIFASGYYQP